MLSLFRTQYSKLLLSVLALLPSTAGAALLQDMYVNASSPLFAEVPVCLNLPNEKASNFQVEIVGNEQINEDGRQPFIDSLNSKIDQINTFDAFITVTSEEPLPENIQLIVTLLGPSGEQVDSRLYSGLNTLRQTPDDLDCEQYVVIEEEIEETQPAEPEVVADAATLPFIIDIVKNDTWRNIASYVNVAWYNNQFSIDQVMASLYQNNQGRNPVVSVKGSMYALPERLEVPTYEVTQQVNPRAASDLARLLDGSGRFTVERKIRVARTAPQAKGKGQDMDTEALKDLRLELAQLRSQLALLTTQLSDSRELLTLRDQELRDIRTEMQATRKRISELETQSLEFSNRGVGYYLKQSLTTPWPWLLLLTLIILFVLQAMSAHQRRQDFERLLRQMKRRDIDEDEESPKKKTL